jgi:hypothetical protein
MEHPTPHPDDARRELREALERLIRQMSRQEWATPRQMQMDAGEAMNRLYELGMGGSYMVPMLTNLVRELGQRRPDLFRFIIALRDFLDEVLGGETEAE